MNQPHIVCVGITTTNNSNHNNNTRESSNNNSNDNHNTGNSSNNNTDYPDNSSTKNNTKTNPVGAIQEKSWRPEPTIATPIGRILWGLPGASPTAKGDPA